MTRVRPGSVLLLSVLAVVAGCSGDDAMTTTTAAATTATTATTTIAPATTTTAPAGVAAAIVITCEPGSGPEFTGQELRGVDFEDETLRCARFDQAVLEDSNVAQTDATGASFRGAEMRQVRFDRATLVGADFGDARLVQVRFRGSDLTGADLRSAVIEGARWDDTVCPDGLNSDDAGSTCDGHLDPVPIEVEATATNAAVAPLEFTPLCAPDSGPDYTNQRLDAPDLRRQDLRCARFSEATITDADFSRLDASGATFDGAALQEVVFESTALFGASFAGAVVTRAQFRNANLIGADITTTEFVDTRWGNTICPNGVNSDDAGGTCLGSRSALDLPEVAFDEITDGDITVRQGGGVTTYTLTNDVLFDFDSDELTEEAAAKLRVVVDSIISRFETRVEIQVWGHADAIGDAAYNLDLSQRRADNVAALLGEAAALAGYRIVPVGLGEAQPIAPNTNADGSDNPDGRALNRRVEIVVRQR